MSGSAHPGRKRPKKHEEEEHENHERWLVSYADFITLLFAFFVVMYAISQVNEGKYRVLSDALLQAFEPCLRQVPAFDDFGRQGRHEDVLTPRKPGWKGVPSQARTTRRRGIAECDVEKGSNAF